MTSKNTLTVEGPNATRDDEKRHAFAFIGQTKVLGGLGQPGCHLHNTGPRTQEEFVRVNYPNWHVQYADRDAGKYHPNIHMGSYERGAVVPPRSADQQRAMITAIEREEILIEDLRQISRVVTPSPATKLAYGSRIRNLLIMACTEVEAQCKAILVANRYKVKPEKMTMKHYVKLAAPLRLAQYRASCERFPDYPSFKPFDGWAPGKRLAWYQAYNDTKHDADGKATNASLEHAISAVGAVCTLVLAQFGPPYLDEASSAAQFFGLLDTPTWRAHERNYPPPPNVAWTPVHYGF